MEILSEENDYLWEKFCEIQKGIMPQHLIAWKRAIETSYKNCEPLYYLNRHDEEIKAIFPFFIVKSRIFGNRAISQPFADFGGPLGEFNEKFLKEILNNLKEKKDISKIEIRLNDFMEDYEKMEIILVNNGFKKNPKKNQFILRLESEEKIWENFSRITRKGIKKAKKSGLQIKEINSEKELKSFYDLYLNNMKSFGTPQHGYNLFRNLMNMEEGFKGLNCYKDNRLIGSLIILYSRDYAYAAYNASDREFLIYQPNDLVHWEIIRFCIKNGLKYFDFGQCDANAKEGTHDYGIYNFKKKWMGKLHNKYYFSHDFGKKDIIEDAKKERGFLTKSWTKLPSLLTKTIGPKIASELAL